MRKYMTSKKNEINGDVALQFKQKSAYIRYGLQHWKENIFKFNKYKKYTFSEYRGFNNDLNSSISPLRAYTNSFLYDSIKGFCPKNARVLDVGCGKGEQSFLFEKLGISGHYYGLDISEDANWQKLINLKNTSLKRKFILSNSSCFNAPNLSADFILSSSALEHIKDDDKTLSNLTQFASKDAFSIHIVPSHWSLFLYVFHGRRRYSPTDLHSLLDKSGWRVEEVYGLGGSATFLLHMIWISIFETGQFSEILFSFLPNNSFFQNIYNLCRKVRIKTARTNFILKKVYVFLLKWTLVLDRFLPQIPHAFAVISTPKENA